MSENDIQEPIRVANTILKGVGVKLVIAQENHIADSVMLNDVNDYRARFNLWESQIIPHIGAIDLLEMPLTTDEVTPGFFIGGVASGLCRYPKNAAIASVFLSPGSLDGKSRTYHNGVTIAHEIGHLLGASHDSSPRSVMASNALASIGDPPRRFRFKAKSKQEIRKCLKEKEL